MADIWRPIDTAPTDGTEVWVFVQGAHDLPSFQCVCAYHPDAGWCADELRHITHWMPKPAPPLAENIQAPVAGIRSALPPSSARERREIIEECARAASMAGWTHAGDDVYSQGMDRGAAHQLCECVKAIRSLSSDGRGREKGNTSNSDDGIDPAPPATGKAESQ